MSPEQPTLRNKPMLLQLEKYSTGLHLRAVQKFSSITWRQLECQKNGCSVNSLDLKKNCLLWSHSQVLVWWSLHKDSRRRKIKIRAMQRHQPSGTWNRQVNLIMPVESLQLLISLPTIGSKSISLLTLSLVNSLRWPKVRHQKLEQHLWRTMKASNQLTNHSPVKDSPIKPHLKMRSITISLLLWSMLMATWLNSTEQKRDP